MNCCGKKRQAWQSEIKPTGRRQIVNEPSRMVSTERPARMFEYMGDQSLNVKGIGSGKNYHFRFRGDRITVDFNDSFALMAERDLKVV